MKIGPWIQDKIARSQHWFETTGKIGDFEGISLADLRARNGRFKETVCSALALVRDVDPRRFRRVQAQIHWIVNCTLEQPGAEYHAQFRTVRVDFEEPTTETDREFLRGFWARTFIHESTHGYLAQRGVDYSDELRSRIERLCVEEENRFIDRLAARNPALAEKLYREFDEAAWTFAWQATPKDRMCSLLKRLRES